MRSRFSSHIKFYTSLCVFSLLAITIAFAGAGAGEAYDILDQAAVDARSGKVEQAQAALTALLKDKATAVMAGYELGLIHYENGDVEKAMPFFKDALSAAFPGAASGKDEKALTALLGQEADAARIRYELGLICQSQGKQDEAAKQFRDGLSIISSKGATYIGVKKCKSCHFKQWNSWRKTEMAKAFDSLKPGVKSEEKTKLKFDPNKDYTKDATCLGCHTSGFGLPGGYIVPADGDAAAKKQADAQTQKKPADDALANVKKQVAAATTAFQAAEQAAQAAEKSAAEKQQAAAQAAAKRKAAADAAAALAQTQQSEQQAQAQATAAARKLTGS